MDEDAQAILDKWLKPAVPMFASYFGSIEEEGFPSLDDVPAFPTDIPPSQQQHQPQQQWHSEEPHARLFSAPDGESDVSETSGEQDALTQVLPFAAATDANSSSQGVWGSYFQTSSQDDELLAPATPSRNELLAPPASSSSSSSSSCVATAAAATSFAQTKTEAKSDSTSDRDAGSDKDSAETDPPGWHADVAADPQTVPVQGPCAVTNAEPLPKAEGEENATAAAEGVHDAEHSGNRDSGSSTDSQDEYPLLDCSTVGQPQKPIPDPPEPVAVVESVYESDSILKTDDVKTESTPDEQLADSPSPATALNDASDVTVLSDLSDLMDTTAPESEFRPGAPHEASSHVPSSLPSRGLVGFSSSSSSSFCAPQTPSSTSSTKDTTQLHTPRPEDGCRVSEQTRRRLIERARQLRGQIVGRERALTEELYVLREKHKAATASSDVKSSSVLPTSPPASGGDSAEHEKAGALLRELRETLRSTEALVERKTDLTFQVQKLSIELERGVRSQAIDAYYAQPHVKGEEKGAEGQAALRARVARVEADNAALLQQNELLGEELRVTQERLQGASVHSGIRSQQSQREAEEWTGRNAILKQHVDELSRALTRQQEQAREERTVLTQQLRDILDGLSRENENLKYTLARHGVEEVLQVPEATQAPVPDSAADEEEGCVIA